MTEKNIPYGALDSAKVIHYLFHPRPETDVPWAPQTPFTNIMIPVDRDISVYVRSYDAGRPGPVILFFHGNGEIAADYDDIAGMFTNLGISFMAADYRGYGRSGGTPSVSAMLKDAGIIFERLRGDLRAGRQEGPFIVMGRSLGSAPALELVSCYGNLIDGLVIESGFAHSDTLLALLGLSLADLGLKEEDAFRNLDKIRTFGKPTLVIHAERDHILPIDDGQALFEASPSPDKVFLRIPGANHNDIFLRGMDKYMKAIMDLCERCRKSVAAS